MPRKSKSITPSLAELIPAIKETFFISGGVIYRRLKGLQPDGTNYKRAGVMRKDRPNIQQIEYRSFTFTNHQLQEILEGTTID